MGREKMIKEHPELRSHVKALLQALEGPVYGFIVAWCEKFNTEVHAMTEEQFMYLFHCALRSITTDEALEEMMALIESEKKDERTYH